MPRLTLTEVQKSYPGRPPVHALRGASATIEPGELVAITGPSGGGKSTLLNVIGLLDRPTDGTYAVGGTDTGSAGPRALAELRSTTFGFVFQSFHLLDRRPVIDSVELAMLYRAVPRTARRAHAQRALTAVGLGDLADQRANTLSGGERQRVAIARALAGGAPVVVADEPTGNLDSINSRAVVESLRDLHRAGSTVVLVTHDPAVAAVAPRLLTLHDGQVVHDTGSPGYPDPAGPGRAEGPPVALGRPSRLRGLDLVRDALASVRSRPGRMAGLVAAVAVAVALTVATSGLSGSASMQVADTFDAHENREVSLTAEAAGDSPTSVTPRVEQTPDQLADRLARLAGVDAAAVLLDHDQHVLQAAPGREETSVLVYSATSGIVPAAALEVTWSADHTDVLADGEILLGANLAQNITLGPLAAGPVVMIDGRSVLVAGVIERSDRLPTLLGAVVAGGAGGAHLGEPTRVTSLLLTQPGAAQQVARLAPLVVDPVAPERLTVTAPVDPRTLRGEIEGQIGSMLAVLTGIALLASIIGLANSMVMSVLERRQEFGLRRAVGARPVHITGLVLGESVLIGATGGLLGLVLGLGAVLVVTLAQRWSPVFDLALAPLAVAGGIVVGAVGGSVAAWRAARIQPSDALRQ
ncbi:ABC transporter ATP-binding protein/permease [Cellulomonas hominis]